MIDATICNESRNDSLHATLSRATKRGAGRDIRERDNRQSVAVPISLETF
jgi:hypothetical protein